MDVPRTGEPSNSDRPTETLPASPSAAPACYDLVVVGAGWLAASVARAAAGKARSVALVVPEQLQESFDCRQRRVLLEALRQAVPEAQPPKSEPRSGGTAALGQSSPTTARVDRVDRPAQWRRLPSDEYAALVAQARQATQTIAAEDQVSRLANCGITVFRGDTRFAGRNTLTVAAVPLRFHRAVLAVEPGCVPAVPAGVDPSASLSLQALCELRQAPGRLGVFGAGPWACTVAQLFRRLGSKVYLFSSEPHLLPGENERAAAIVQQTLLREGVRLRLGCDALSGEQMGRHQAVVASRAGRREKILLDQWTADLAPGCRLQALQPQAAGITTDSFGAAVNRRLQTSNRRVFALNAAMTTAVWHDAAVELVSRRLVQAATTPWWAWSRGLPPIRCTWTSPQLLQVGLTAEQAAATYTAVRTYQSEPGEPVPAVQHGNQAAWAALHTEESSGRLLGASVVGQRTRGLATVLTLLFQGQITLDSAAALAASEGNCGEVLAGLLDQYRRERPGLVARVAARFAFRHRPVVTGGSQPVSAEPPGDQ